MFDDDLVTVASGPDLFHLRDQEQEALVSLVWTGNRADLSQAALRDLSLAFRLECLGDIDQFEKWSAFGELRLDGLEQILSDHEPVPFPRHGGGPLVET